MPVILRGLIFQATISPTPLGKVCYTRHMCGVHVHCAQLLLWWATTASGFYWYLIMLFKIFLDWRFICLYQRHFVRNVSGLAFWFSRQLDIRTSFPTVSSYISARVNRILSLSPDYWRLIRIVLIALESFYSNYQAFMARYILAILLTPC